MWTQEQDRSSKAASYLRRKNDPVYKARAKESARRYRESHQKPKRPKLWNAEKQRAFYAEWIKLPANREKVRAASARWRAKNPEKIKARNDISNTIKGKEYTARYRLKNPEKRRKSCKQYRDTHVEQQRSYSKQYTSEHLPQLAARATKRRAAKLKATPAWANHSKIEDFYAAAARLTESTGVQHDVDHIVPLQNKRVCGLHCEDNLQILGHIENISKGNRWECE